MRWIDTAFPVQPQAARFFGIEVVFNFESKVARKRLGATPNEKVVIGVLHDSFGYQRRSAHAFECGNTSGLLPRTVHTAGIELYDAIGIWQSAIADTCFFRIQFNNVDTSDKSVKYIVAACNTASAHAMDALSAELPVPVIGRLHHGNLWLDMRGAERLEELVDNLSALTLPA